MIISIWAVGGMVMMQLGVVGVYLGRVFNQTKNRPSYVVDEVVNITGNDR
jgi:dolichol-phosphate mannosyltransferase